MNTYLVTGGSGFIGSNYVLYMIERYPDIKIINLDKLTYAGNKENLTSVEKNKNYTFIKGDICDKKLIKELFSGYDIDYVINFAAESHVDRSILDPEIFVRTNVLGTVILLNEVKEAWGCDEGFKEDKKFLQISTDEVYGSLGETGLFNENTPLDPHSPYSSSKAGADLIVKAYWNTYGMPVNITRCTNNYGPFQFPEKLIPLIIRNCLKMEKLPIYGDGLNIRDWLYVEDHCKAIDLVIKKGRPGEIYNVGGNNEKGNIDIAREIINYLNEKEDAAITEELISFVQDRPGHDRRYGIDSGKIREELGWYPETVFEEGIKKTIDWYLNNRDWMKNISLRSR